MYLSELVFLVFSAMYPGVELLGHMAALFLAVRETSALFSTVCSRLHQLTFPPTVHKCYLFSTNRDTIFDVSVKENLSEDVTFE